MAGLACKLRSVLSKLSEVNTNLKIVRHGSYYSSPFLEDVGKISTKYETSRDPEEWKCVENILPPLTIPQPVKKEYYSGWKPQAENLQDRPYYIRRTKNHMIPVYLLLAQNNIRRHTVIKHIQGDIWLFEKELTDFLKTLTIKPIRIQVNEFVGNIKINGDFVNAIKYFLEQKGY